MARSERTPASRRQLLPKRSSSSSEEAERRRRSRAAPVRTDAGSGTPSANDRARSSGSSYDGRELEAAGSRHEDRREGPSERLVRSVRDGVERRGLRERLGERRGDPVEPPLDARLAHALLEARGVPHGQRGQTARTSPGGSTRPCRNAGSGSLVATPSMPRRSPDHVMGAAIALANPS